MDYVILGKSVCALASFASGCASCMYWYKSSRAEATESEAHIDDLMYEIDGRYVPIVATAKKQGALSAKGALFAAIALFFQLIPAAHEAWLSILGS